MVFVISAFILVAEILAAIEFNHIAELKGYSGTKYGWWCALFPAAGYLMVIALPDQRKQNLPAPSTPADSSDELPDL